MSVSAANARRATVEDRTEMAVEIATDIHFDQKYLSPNPFKTNAVELGPTAIEDSTTFGDIALADWHSADGRVHGQVLLINMCGWHVKAVSVGRRLRAQDYTGRADPAVTNILSKLSADLTVLEAQHVAYLKPARPVIGC
jgi:hypothetical protein